MKKIIGAFVIASIGGITALGLNRLFEQKSNLQTSQIAYQLPAKYVNMPSVSTENAVDFTTAAEMSVHSVVNVKTTYPLQTQNQYLYDPFRDFFGQREPKQQEAPMATGSGVIISQDGYVVTNNHVVDGAEKVEITLNDKRSYTAEVIGKDPTTDLALLKIKETLQICNWMHKIMFFKAQNMKSYKNKIHYYTSAVAVDSKLPS